MSRAKVMIIVSTVVLCPTNIWAQLASTTTPSTPADLQINVTNEGPSDFTLTPLWFAFQNGNFDLFNPGGAPSAGLELLAEDGVVDSPDPNVTTITTEFDAASQPGNRQGVVLAPGGFAGAPVIEPGETGTAYITPINPANYQYFSFASMVIPSNDTFLGNANPIEYQVFTPDGNINDPSGVFTIQLFGSDLSDAGTEANDALGAAFSTNGGVATDTNDGVGSAGDLSEFLNTTTLSGLTITDLISSNELVATITITQLPEPSTSVLGILSVVVLGMSWRVRLRQRRS